MPVNIDYFRPKDRCGTDPQTINASVEIKKDPNDNHKINLETSWGDSSVTLDFAELVLSTEDIGEGHVLPPNTLYGVYEG